MTTGCSSYRTGGDVNNIRMCAKMNRASTQIYDVKKIRPQFALNLFPRRFWYAKISIADRVRYSLEIMFSVVIKM